MLAGHDELFLLSSLHRNLYRTKYDKKHSASGVSGALSDLKAFSEGLVDWVLSRSLIERGQWPSRHVLLFCEKIAASADRGRATNIFRQLLCRIHASSIEVFEKEKHGLLKGLSIVLAVIGPNGPLIVLTFLEVGKAQQRVRVLCVATDLNMQFARQTLGDLACCLLSEGQHMSDPSLLATFLEDEYALFQQSRLGEVSRTFCYLQTVMEPAASDSGASQQVAEKLKEFQTKAEQGKREHEHERQQEREQECKREQERQRQQISEEQSKKEPVEESNENSRRNQPRLLKKLNQESEHLSLATLAVAVKMFKPTLCKTFTWHDANQLHMYCSVKMWETSGLFQHDEIDKYSLLSDTHSVMAENAFKSLMTLKGPWITGFGQKDGSWEQDVFKMMQDKTLGLGRIMFTVVLLHVQQRIQSSPDTAIEELKLLQDKIEQWQTLDASEQLEQRFLLKQLRIGCRSQEFPTWTGLVSEHSNLMTLPRATDDDSIKMKSEMQEDKVQAPIRVFLGCDVSSDAELVERLYDKLKAKGANVQWHKLAGQWREQDLADELCSSDIYVPILSKAGLARFEHLTEQSRCNYLVLEHQMALELFRRSDLRAIFPVFVGELRYDSSLGKMYGDFFQDECVPRCSDVVVKAIEGQLVQLLEYSGKGAPQLPASARTVKATFGAITSFEGFKLRGRSSDAWDQAVDAIEALALSVSHLSAAVTSVSARYVHTSHKVFLSYQEQSDADLVECLYDKLKAEGVNVW